MECCGVDGYKDWQRNGTAFEAKYKGKFCGETINNMNPVVREIIKEKFKLMLQNCRSMDEKCINTDLSVKITVTVFYTGTTVVL